jgi:hypothetical protein
MTIRSGEAWGDTVARPDDLIVVSSDADLAEHVARGDGRPVGLDGGDLHNSVGAPGHRDPVQRLPIDVLRLRADGRDYVAVAHVILRRRTWLGPIVAVMNVDRVGKFDVAPRAHPNDGRFDIVSGDATMSVRQRLQARRRLRHGTHVPHDAISVRRAVGETWRFDRRLQMWIDGVRRESIEHIEIEIETDAATIYV